MVDDTYRMDWGAELKALRERTGLSLEAVAKLIGMSRGTAYNHYETRLKDKYVPLHVINKLIPVFTKYGIRDVELLRVGGLEEKYLQQIDLNRAVLIRLLEEVPKVSAEFGIAPDAETVAGLIADMYPEACELYQRDGLSPDVVRLAVSASRPRSRRET